MTARAGSIETFRAIYDRFQAAVSRYDCGRHCAPLNDGEPVCCTTRAAIPIVQRNEYKLLKTRTDMWRRFKPKDAASRKVVDDLHEGCLAVECRGARHCERDNRTLACRAFPFFPYFERGAADFVGLAYYWIFEDRCWLMSHLEVVERQFVDEFCAAYTRMFDDDEDERRAYRDHSASMRRIFTRAGRKIPLIGRAGGYFEVLPRTGQVVPADPARFRRHGPYASARAYAAAVKAAGGTLPEGLD